MGAVTVSIIAATFTKKESFQSENRKVRVESRGRPI